MKKDINMFQKSIVKILSDMTVYDYLNPWITSKKMHVTGSGFCIEINDVKYIMTNAHCVRNAITIQVRKLNDDKLYKMKTVFIIDECDLAILAIDDVYYNSSGKTVNCKKKPPVNRSSDIVNFWKELPALEIGSMPDKLEKVYIFGYPFGGYNISITKGVINRIGELFYMNIVAGSVLQVDAPINFGNSGGPAVNKKGKVVGVVFATLDVDVVQNMGYLIPVFLIEYFIKVFTQNIKFTGLSVLGIETQNLNTPLKAFFKTKESGVLITDIHNNSSAFNILKKYDIITKISGFKVNDDATIPLSALIRNKNSNLIKNEVIHLNNLVSLQIPGEVIDLTIIRKGKPKNVKIKLKSGRPLILEQSIIEPAYVIIGGLVFIPLTIAVIKMNKKILQSVSDYIRKPVNEEEQLILLSKILTTRVTEGYNDGEYILQSVNDTDIKNLEHFKEVLNKEIKSSKFLKFDFKNTNNIIVLEVQEVLKNDKLLKEYIGINY